MPKLRKKVRSKRIIGGSLVKVAKRLKSTPTPKAPVALAAIDAAASSVEAAPKQYKKIMPYVQNDSVLLIGEGNFSFANALCFDMVNPEKLVATCLDSKEILEEKYPDVLANTDNVIDAGASVHYNVDCSKLQKLKILKGKRFSKIVFNFPHAGKGIKDQDRNVAANQALVCEFLKSALDKLSCIVKGDEEDGQIHLTVKTGDPYDLWEVKKIAKRVGLSCKTSWKFHPELYNGYVHRRTLGYQQGLSVEDNQEILKNAPRTYCFVLDKQVPVVSNKQQSAKSSSSKIKKHRDSDNDDE